MRKSNASRRSDWAKDSVPATPENRRRSRAALAIAAVASVLSIGPAYGGTVTTDGSLGRAGALAGPNFAITANLGKQVGPNLFHSFTAFSLDAGESATFSGPANVANVIARVTGGSPSLINGTLAVTIPKANFYLVNPSGVLFGPSSSLDVSGACVVTTADYLKMADGKHFNATHLSDTTLTTAPPAAFGFLSSQPGPIIVDGCTFPTPATPSASSAATCN